MDCAVIPVLYSNCDQLQVALDCAYMIVLDHTVPQQIRQEVTIASFFSFFLFFLLIGNFRPVDE